MKLASALTPIASPPSYGIIIVDFDHAIKSICIHGISFFTNLFKNKAAVIAPPNEFVPIFLKSACKDLS